jgi:hypothetical protein
MSNVTQEDRGAAADLVKWQQNATKQWKQGEGEAWQFFAAGFSRAIRQGIWDEHPLVQAFAAHRQATASSLAVENERLREELEQCAADFEDHSDFAQTRIEDGAEMGATVWRLALEDIKREAGQSAQRARAALQGE